MAPTVLMTAVTRLPPALLAASLAGWAALMVLDQSLLLPTICGGGSLVGVTFVAALTTNPPTALLVGWLAMVLAMMPPLLAMPITHLWRRSLNRRRHRAMILFTCGYGVLWLAAAVPLTAAAIALRVVTATSIPPAAAVAVLMALVWQAVPLKQLCLNRCHRQPRIGAFGLKADADAFRFGITHGLWCVGACWPLMLLPLAAATTHLPLMGAVMLVLFAERLRLPQPARWGFSLPPWPTSVAISSVSATRAVT